MFWKSLLPNVIRESAYVPEFRACNSVYFLYDVRRHQFEVVTSCGLLGTPTFEGEGLAARKS
jgi:hypothetical protein